MKNIGFELYCHFSFLPPKKLRLLTDVQSILLVYSNTYFSAYKFLKSVWKNILCQYQSNFIRQNQLLLSSFSLLSVYKIIHLNVPNNYPFPI